MRLLLINYIANSIIVNFMKLFLDRVESNI